MLHSSSSTRTVRALIRSLVMVAGTGVLTLMVAGLLLGFIGSVAEGDSLVMAIAGIGNRLLGVAPVALLGWLLIGYEIATGSFGAAPHPPLIRWLYRGWYSMVGLWLLVAWAILRTIE